jgi:DNA-binding response OmpR family regulator
MQRRHRVLVVDDNPLVLATLADYLRREDFEVTAAVTAAAALDCVRQQRFDMALLDFAMPEMHGLELGRLLAQLRQPFMFLTGVSHQEAVDQMTAVGALDYLVKPADPAHLVSVVRHLIGSP